MADGDSPHGNLDHPAPADALAKFWDELRSKARVEIDHPDLPAPLRDTAAAAIAAIWQQASASARGELATLRLEVQEQLEAGRTELGASQHQAAALGEQLQAAHGQVTAANAAADRTREELEAERRAHAGTLARLQQLQTQLSEQQAQQEAARTAFSADLAKAREAVDVANARADASDRRALLEIDQERQARTRADRQFEALRAELAQAQSRQRDAALTAADGQTRLQARVEALEQANRELRAAAERAADDLHCTRELLSTSQAEGVRHKTEADTLRDVLQRLTPAGVAPTTKSPRARRG